MIKVSDALTEVVKTNHFLQYGLHHKLLNLSQVARFLRPFLAARTKKEVQTSALLMSLSRLQSKMAASSSKVRSEIHFEVDNITVQSDLAIVTVEKNRDSHRQTGLIYNKVQAAGAYITITEGLSEITLILDRQFLKVAEELLSRYISISSGTIAAVSAKFSEKYLKTPGFLFTIIESLFFQGINILEVASTSTELILYVRNEDVQLAFNTLYTKFRKGAVGR